jgi:hypothetical protein
MMERERISGRLYSFNQNGTTENIEDMHQVNNCPSLETSGLQIFFLLFHTFLE